MTAEKERMLKLKNNKICKLISKCDFTQKLNFSHCKRNTLINTADVININKIKNKYFLLKHFLAFLFECCNLQ